MATNYDSVDLYFSEEGDFALDSQGDTIDTSFDSLRSIKQEVRTRVMGQLRDWKIYPSIGANLADFIGEPNDRGNALSIQNRIVNSLTFDGLIKREDLNVALMPLSQSSIFCKIELNILTTTGNSKLVNLATFLYDSQENGVRI